MREGGRTCKHSMQAQCAQHLVHSSYNCIPRSMSLLFHSAFNQARPATNCHTVIAGCRWKWAKSVLQTACTVNGRLRVA